jgi:hypothetical protein
LPSLRSGAKRAAEAWFSQMSSSAVRSIKRATVRDALEAYLADLRLPAGHVRLNQAFEMGPQCFEGREHRSKVCGVHPFDPPRSGG